MNIVTNHLEVFKKFSDFTGKSSRSQYWFFILTQICVSITLALTLPSLYLLYTVLSIVPGIALLIRRLRDAGFSPYFALLSLIPLVNLWLLLLLVQPSK